MVLLYSSVFGFLLLLLVILQGIYVEKFSVYNHSTKCFSCEKDIINRLGPEWGWLGQDTKSFDSEFDLIKRSGDVSSAFNTHDLRYY